MIMVHRHCQLQQVQLICYPFSLEIRCVFGCYAKHPSAKMPASPTLHLPPLSCLKPAGRVWFSGGLSITTGKAGWSGVWLALAQQWSSPEAVTLLSQFMSWTTWTTAGFLTWQWCSVTFSDNLCPFSTYVCLELHGRFPIFLQGFIWFGCVWCGDWGSAMYEWLEVFVPVAEVNSLWTWVAERRQWQEKVLYMHVQ